jgi:hypothetical protein
MSYKRDRRTDGEKALAWNNEREKRRKNILKAVKGMRYTLDYTDTHEVWRYTTGDAQGELRLCLINPYMAKRGATTVAAVG